MKCYICHLEIKEDSQEGEDYYKCVDEKSFICMNCMELKR